MLTDFWWENLLVCGYFEQYETDKRLTVRMGNTFSGGFWWWQKMNLGILQTLVTEHWKQQTPKQKSHMWEKVKQEFLYISSESYLL